MTHPRRGKVASIERSFHFRATIDAPRLARQALDGWLSSLVGPARADDVRLLTTELVSNAVRHGGVPPDGEITVDVRTSPSSVTVVVGQPTSVERVGLQRGEVDAPEQGGIGLHLVERLADEWGVEHGVPGSVWFGVLRLPENLIGSVVEVALIGRDREAIGKTRNIDDLPDRSRRCH